MIGLITAFHPRLAIPMHQALAGACQQMLACCGTLPCRWCLECWRRGCHCWQARLAQQLDQQAVQELTAAAC